MNLSKIEKQIFCTVAGDFKIPDGAYNFRVNGKSVGRSSSDNIDVISKTDVSGLDIFIKPNTKNEAVHIPVAISKTGLKEAVYNDFHIGDNADVTIVAGCGIYNCGELDSIHDGIHRFYVGKNSKIKYIEKHFGFGAGAGGKILNPVTEVFLEEGAVAELYMEQIKGVDSTKRQTRAKLKKDAKLFVNERLFTHGRQTAISEYKIDLAGENSTTDINSRSIAQDISRQTFRSKIIGRKKCRGHSACDAIIMDGASVLALPALDAKCVDAELIHEAAIGKIAGEELTKLMTLGLTYAEAESKIINGFLK
ncbi:SufD family Fe-S cluster assembly protein [Candidatus Saccharibacteria bacterium]|nr:SufD family Fe-S cluster assembly protein [Candidatus Saccharibacteria bacterium]MBR6964890.1 SufD family Fe-S cluster assembly protein [Candidatus Saccharibacteria bacterium]